MLVVHRENTFLPQKFRQGDSSNLTYLREQGDLPAEVALFFQLDINGVFSDNPDVAADVRDQLFR